MPSLSLLTTLSLSQSGDIAPKRTAPLFGGFPCCLSPSLNLIRIQNKSRLSQRVSPFRKGSSGDSQPDKPWHRWLGLPQNIQLILNQVLRAICFKVRIFALLWYNQPLITISFALLTLSNDKLVDASPTAIGLNDTR